MIENQTVASNGYGISDRQEQTIRRICQCAGCKQSITTNDEYVDHHGEYLHDDDDCLAAYVRKDIVKVV